MTIEQLERALLERAPADEGVRREWTDAVARLMEAARAPASIVELTDRLPRKARYVGPGPWLDAIRDSYRP